jgi:hypothetical protein
MSGHDIPASLRLYKPADEVAWQARIDADLLTDCRPSGRHRSLEAHHE